MAELNARQARFVDAYLTHGNATRAYEEAGYKPDPTGSLASRLIGNDRVAAEIARRQAEASAAADVTAQDVRRELARLAFSDIRDVVEWETGRDEDGRAFTRLTLKDSAALTDDAAAAIHEVRVDAQGRLTVRMHDKQRALEAHMRDLGMGRDTDDFPTDIVIQLKWPEDE